jgi:Ca2+-binding EF-hand superfamily protein
MFPFTRNEKLRSARTILVWPALPAAQTRTDQIFRRLDRNRDGRLSPDEIESAPEVLRSLDQDWNGKVTAEECGLLHATVAAQQRAAGAFGILDQDGNGELSEAETARASATLRVFARDRDGSIALSAINERTRRLGVSQ